MAIEMAVMWADAVNPRGVLGHRVDERQAEGVSNHG